MPHDGHPHPHVDKDHNHVGHVDHLHSHPIGASNTIAHDDAVQDWIDNFIPGFRAAEDKTGFLRLAKIPFEIEDEIDGPALKLVDVTVEDAFQVATASPAFGSPDLIYQPYPGHMVRQRTDVRFVYVSLKTRRDIMLVEMAGLIPAV